MTRQNIFYNLFGTVVKYFGDRWDKPIDLCGTFLCVAVQNQLSFRDSINPISANQPCSTATTMTTVPIKAIQERTRTNIQVGSPHVHRRRWKITKFGHALTIKRTLPPRSRLIARNTLNHIHRTPRTRRVYQVGGMFTFIKHKLMVYHIDRVIHGPGPTSW